MPTTEIQALILSPTRDFVCRLPTKLKLLKYEKVLM
jgi:hypothetical protein